MVANNTFSRFIRPQARAVKEQTTLYREPSTFNIRPNCPLDSQASQGFTHCDIKDENILVDNYLNVRFRTLSPSISHSNVNVDLPQVKRVDPSEPRPCYTIFFGTTAYAASEVLLKKPYRAPPSRSMDAGHPRFFLAHRRFSVLDRSRCHSRACFTCCPRLCPRSRISRTAHVALPGP